MLKRIWAVVSDPDFYAFQQRAKREGLDMGQALASIVHAYAKGDNMHTCDVKAYKDRLDYLKAREEISVPKQKLEDVQGGR